MTGSSAIGVLISGSGTNLQALIDAQVADRLAGGRIAVVVSNRADAPGLQRAKESGIPTLVVDHRRRGREDFEREVTAGLEHHRVELVVLAGFMRVLTPAFIDHWKGRLINVHPALLPAFPGTHAQRQALEFGVHVTGCTVHFVDTGVDTGPIILQRSVPVHPGDSEEGLKARILAQEHEILPEAVRLFISGRLRVEGRHVRIVDAEVPRKPTSSARP